MTSKRAVRLAYAPDGGSQSDRRLKVHTFLRPMASLPVRRPPIRDRAMLTRASRRLIAAAIVAAARMRSRAQDAQRRLGSHSRARGKHSPNSGSTSALGLLLTDIRHDCVRTFCVATMMRLRATFKRLSMSLRSGRREVAA